MNGGALARAVFLALAAGMLPGLAWGPAWGQGIDLSHGGPVHVTANGGIQWLQQQHEVIATGGATAVRQDVTVTADRLIAFYRKRASAGAPGKPAPAAATGAADIAGEDDGGNEIYRLVAEGHVVISTPTDRAVGDRAVYDLDKAVLVLTGHHVRLTTPTDVLTARDDLEYWSDKHMAVARGDAVVVTKDHHRLAADVLVAYTKPAEPSQADGSKPADHDSLTQSGKLEKVEAFGHVVVSTPTEVVTGDRAVYVPDTGIALLVGKVRITRGPNELAGSEAEVNLKTGVSRLLSKGSSRVTGLIVPDSTKQDSTKPAAPAGKAGR